jgi:hypothetical protein
MPLLSPWFRWSSDLKLDPNQIVPTNLTSIVVWRGGSDVITVRKAPSGGLKERKLDIVVGSERRFFEGESNLWQDFNGELPTPGTIFF